MRMKSRTKVDGWLKRGNLASRVNPVLQIAFTFQLHSHSTSQASPCISNVSVSIGITIVLSGFTLTLWSSAINLFENEVRIHLAAKRRCAPPLNSN